MRKFLPILFVLWANILFSQTYGDYYDNAIGLSNDALKTALYNIIKGHTEFPYTSTSTDTWDILKETDRDPNNSANVIFLYSGQSILAGAAGNEYRSASGWSREHVWPQSLGDFSTSSDRWGATDVHHLRPEDISVNSTRNNRSFDNCQTCVEVWDNGLFTGSYYDSNEWTFEPRDAVKGDVARMMFYMATRYEGENGESDLQLIEGVSGSSPYLGSLSTLLAWNRIDPVDDWERNRNEIIYNQFQHNRNPFIDIPELAEYLWGTAVGTAWTPGGFTDETAPTFTVVPADGETNVSISSNIKFTYNESIRNLNNTEITDANVNALLIFKETNASGADVPYTAIIDNNKLVITITPTENLKIDQVYYVSITAVEDASDNASASGNTSFTTITEAPTPSQVIITQYYEGASNDKYIEITNVGSTTIDLSTYYLGRFSNTDNPLENAVYSDGDALSGTIAAKQTLVYKNAGAANPSYAEESAVASTTATYFNGNDPIALMDGGNTWGNRVDCIYASTSSGDWGAEKSFYRKESVTVGNLNMSVLDGSGEWVEVSTSTVDDASSSDSEYLGTHFAAGDETAPTLTFTPNNGQTNVAINTTVILTFNEAVRNIDDTEITNANLAALLAFKENNTSGANVDFTATIDAEKKVITLYSEEDLINNQLYYIAIDAVEDDSDNATSATNSTFTTIAAAGPEISNVSITETGPYFAGEEASLTWVSNNVDFVKVEIWIPIQAAWSELSASTESDGSEVYTIAAEANYSTDYKIRVSDVLDAAIFAESATFEIIATPSIYDVQYNTSDGDLSNYDGQKVRISGIVTAIAGSNFWIQESEATTKSEAYPAWAGIFGYDPNTADALSIGDDIILEATIEEYYNATEIVDVTNYTVNSAGNIIDPVAVVAADASEAFESTLIIITNAEVTTDADSYGEFTINDGTADYIVDDKIFAYVPTVGDVLNITGVTTYSYGAFKIYPRSADDIVVASALGVDDVLATEINIYPNPNNGKFFIQLGNAFKANTKIEVFNVVGMKVFEILVNNHKTEINLSSMKQGVYYVRVDGAEKVITQKIIKQ